MKFDASQYLTLRRAAQKLGVTPDTLSRWVRAGRIPAVRLPGGHYRLHEDDLWLAMEPVVPPGSDSTDNSGVER